MRGEQQFMFLYADRDQQQRHHQHAADNRQNIMRDERYDGEGGEIVHQDCAAAAAQIGVTANPCDGICEKQRGAKPLS